MSREVLQIVGIMDQSELETQLVLQGVPLLMRIKISNLFIIHKSNKDAVISNLSDMIQLFDQYNKAKEMVIRMISQGVSILNILDIKDSNNNKKIAV